MSNDRFGDKTEDGWLALIEPECEGRVCIKCKEVTFMPPRITVGGVSGFSPVLVCPTCSAKEAAERKGPSLLELAREAGVPGDLLEDSLSHSLDSRLADIGLTRSPGRWMQGVPGTGKSTQAALAVLNYLERNPDARVVYTLEDTMLSRVADDECSARSLARYTTRAELLVIDECGRGAGAGWRRDLHTAAYNKIIDSRYQAKQPTIWVTNFDLMKGVGERCPSLYDAHVLSRIMKMLGTFDNVLDFETDWRRAAFMRGGQR